MTHQGLRQDNKMIRLETVPDRVKHARLDGNPPSPLLHKKGTHQQSGVLVLTAAPLLRSAFRKRKRRLTHSSFTVCHSCPKRQREAHSRGRRSSLSSSVSSVKENEPRFLVSACKGWKKSNAKICFGVFWYDLLMDIQFWVLKSKNLLLKGNIERVCSFSWAAIQWPSVNLAHPSCQPLVESNFFRQPTASFAKNRSCCEKPQKKGRNAPIHVVNKGCHKWD